MYSFPPHGDERTIDIPATRLQRVQQVHVGEKWHYAVSRLTAWGALRCKAWQFPLHSLSQEIELPSILFQCYIYGNVIIYAIIYIHIKQPHLLHKCRIGGGITPCNSENNYLSAIKFCHMIAHAYTELPMCLTQFVIFSPYAIKYPG